MPVYSVWMLEKQNITVSGGGTLDGITQGDGSHLVGRTITFDANAWKQTFINDNDTNFDDNDGNQTLAGAQTVNGVTYPNGRVVEAEYRIVLTDGNGNFWTAYAYNINNSNPAYGTVEGMVLRPDANGNYPPTGVPLTVVQAGEGPNGTGTNPYDLYDEPPCFTPGTLIATPSGPRLVEDLRPGDLVLTLDKGAQPVRWVGRVDLSSGHLQRHPEHRPVRILRGALAPGLPVRDLILSPQHRVMMRGWKAELLFAEPEVLVPAVALRNDDDICIRQPAAGVSYLHLLFDRHEIIFAEGSEVESLHAPWFDRVALPKAVLAELEAFFPDLLTNAPAMPLARPCVTVSEGRTFAH
jgi:Hint domain